MPYKSVVGYDVEYPYDIASRICRGFSEEFPIEDELRQFVSETRRIWDAFRLAENLIISLREENKRLKEITEFQHRTILELTNC